MATIRLRPPAAHARRELGETILLCAAFQLHAAGFAGCASPLSGSPARQIARSRFAREGLSLACHGFRSPGPPLQDQTIPACRFAIPDEPSTLPGPLSNSRPRSFPHSGPINTEKPVAKFPTAVPVSYPANAPPWDFHPSGSSSLAAFCSPLRVRNAPTG